MGIDSDSSKASGQGFSADLFIVIPNYYSPDFPNGDTAMLAGVDLQLGVGKRSRRQ